MQILLISKINHWCFFGKIMSFPRQKFNKLFIVYIHLFNLTDLREPQYTIKTFKV